MLASCHSGATPDTLTCPISHRLSYLCTPLLIVNLAASSGRQKTVLARTSLLSILAICKTKLWRRGCAPVAGARKTAGRYQLPAGQRQGAGRRTASYRCPSDGRCAESASIASTTCRRAAHHSSVSVMHELLEICKDTNSEAKPARRASDKRHSVRGRAGSGLRRNPETLWPKPEVGHGTAFRRVCSIHDHAWISVTLHRAAAHADAPQRQVDQEQRVARIRVLPNRQQAPGPQQQRGRGAHDCRWKAPTVVSLTSCAKPHHACHLNSRQLPFRGHD